MSKPLVLAVLLCLAPCLALAAEPTKPPAPAAAKRVVMETSKGTIEIELFPDAAPETVKNFLAYVDAEFYDGLIFHRVVPGFVIQGGGFEPGMKQRPTKAPITNEAKNGKANLRGTLSMARTAIVNSATSQFFINLKDNMSLDHRGESPSEYGYAVFGRVAKGMEVVDAIAKVSTGSSGGHQNVPKEDVVIKSARIL